MYFFFFQAEDGIRDYKVTGVQTCALPILDALIQAENSERLNRANLPILKAVEFEGGKITVRQGKMTGCSFNFTPTDGRERSEERRVGKECRSRWSPYH